MDRRFRNQRAFTLPEVLAASVVIALAVAAITQVIVAGQMQAYDGVRGMRAADLGESLLDEILALPYDDPDGASNPGPEAGETNRTLFDNADDFHGYTEAAGNLGDFTGTLYEPEFQTFSRAVTASYGSQTVTGFTNPIDGLTVTVVIEDDRGTMWVISRFIPEPVE